MTSRRRTWWLVPAILCALAVPLVARAATEGAVSAAPADSCPSARPLVPQAQGLLRSFEAGGADAQATAVGLKSIEARMRVLAREADDSQQQRLEELTDALAAARSAIATDASALPETIAVLEDALAVTARLCAS